MGLHCFERLENNDCLFHSLIYQLKTLRVLILLSQGLINTHEFGLRCLHISSPWLISCNCNQLLPCQWGHCFKYNSHLGLFVIIRFELVLVLCTRTSFKSINCAFSTIALILGLGYFSRTDQQMIPWRFCDQWNFLTFCLCSCLWLPLYAKPMWPHMVHSSCKTHDRLTKRLLDNNSLLHWFSLLFHFWGLNIIW